MREARGNAAAEALCRQSADASVSYVPLDLVDFVSVVEFTRRLADEYPAGIHVLVCNGGIGGTDQPSESTPDGADLVYRVNFVSHFILVQRLLPLLERGTATASVASRVVTLSSVMHRYGHTRWTEPLAFQPDYSTYAASIVLK